MSSGTKVNVDLTVQGNPKQVITVGVLRQEYIQGGVPETGVSRVEQYVLLSSLPAELQQRIKVAVDFNRAGM